TEEGTEQTNFSRFVRWRIQFNPGTFHHLIILFDDFIRSRKKFGGECQSDLFRCLQVDHKLKLRRLLHRQISRFGTFQNLVHVNSRAPKEVIDVSPIGHEPTLIDKLLLEVNTWQPMFDCKLDNALPLGEKSAI